MEVEWEHVNTFLVREGIRLRPRDSSDSVPRGSAWRGALGDAPFLTMGVNSAPEIR